MECSIQWIGNRSFVAETGSGHTVVMDGAPSVGGRDLAPRPMEMMLAGLGGCSAFDVVMILEKGKHAVTDCQIKIQAERAETDPKVFTQVHLTFRITGKSIKPEAVERAVKLSADKYCSASAMFAKSATITHSIELIEG